MLQADLAHLAICEMQADEEKWLLCPPELFPLCKGSSSEEELAEWREMAELRRAHLERALGVAEEALARGIDASTTQAFYVAKGELERFDRRTGWWD